MRHRLQPRAPWWAWPVVIFLAARLLDAAMIIIAAKHQIAVDTTIRAFHTSKPAHPGYLGVATNWDGQYYAAIALHGYPQTLPVKDGMVLASEWAFAPLYPLTVRILMELTGLTFASAGTVLTLMTSLAAVATIHRLLLEHLGRFAARATTLLLCTSMAAPAFQITYTEGPALLFVALTLLNLQRERYGWAALTLLGLGLTRHVVAPFVLVLAIHALSKRRQVGHWNPAALRLVVVGAGITVLWPATAAVVTGRLTAFTDTQKAWRLHPTTTGPFGLFSVGWEVAGFGGVLVAGMLAGAVLWFALRRDGPRWSPEVRTWTATYPLYLFAVAPVAVSMFRLMLLAFPLMWVFGESRPTPRSHRVTVAVLAVAGLALQWFWIRYILVIGPPGDHLAIP